TLALREAAKSVAGVSGKKSLILIHDDADNCQPDLCAVAQELRAAKIVVHVVGLGLKADDAAKMLCLPQLTSGRLFTTPVPMEVAAAIEEALLLASGDSGPHESSAGPAALTVPSALPIPADGAPGLYLRASLAPNIEPIGWPLNWTVSVDGQRNAILFSG